MVVEPCGQRDGPGRAREAPNSPALKGHVDRPVDGQVVVKRLGEPTRTRTRHRSAVRIVLALALLAGCSSNDREEAVSPAPPEVSSTALTDGGVFPMVHTCDGEDLPLPVSWDGSHPDAVEVVLVVDDPDAPGGSFVHWLVAGLPGTGSIVDGALPSGAIEGVNDFGEVGYSGPCPPPGDAAHSYRIEVIGVAEPTGLEVGFTAGELERATAGQQLSSANLTGRYSR